MYWIEETPSPDKKELTVEEKRAEIRKTLKPNESYVQWGNYADKEDQIVFSKNLDALYKELKKSGNYDNLTRADLLEFADRIALLESNRNPLAIAPNTTASGLFQITHATSKDAYKNAERILRKAGINTKNLSADKAQFGTPEDQLLMLIALAHGRSNRQIPFDSFKEDFTNFRDWYYVKHHTQGYEHPDTQSNFDNKMINYNPLKDVNYFKSPELLDNWGSRERVQYSIQKKEKALLNEVKKGRLTQSQADWQLNRIKEAMFDLTTPTPTFTKIENKKINADGTPDYSEATYRDTEPRIGDLRQNVPALREEDYKLHLEEMRKIRLQQERERFEDYRSKVLMSRGTPRQNPDGTESTHLMTYGTTDKGYAVYPTIFQDENHNYYTPKDPFEEAKKKNEVYIFPTEREAKSFAEGSWKIQMGQTMDVPTEYKSGGDFNTVLATKEEINRRYRKSKRTGREFNYPEF